MSTRLYACHFEQPGYEGDWARLARVLRASAAAHCPGWSIEVQEIHPGRIKSPMHRVYVGNTQKLERWATVVAASEDGDRLLLIDVDTMVLQSLDDVWDLDFDVAYTSKPPGAMFPFNLGVVFLRVSARTRAFMAAWVARNRALLEAPAEAREWRVRYGGINQAAFALVRGGEEQPCRLVEVPCATWNCEESGWPEFDVAATRILHVKGELRRVVFGRQAPTRETATAASVWRAADRELGRTRRTG